MKKDRLTFSREDKTWYIKLNNYIGTKHSRSMVAGADTLLDNVSKLFAPTDADIEISVEVITGNNVDEYINRPDCVIYEKTNSSITGGADYKCIHEAEHFDNVQEMWLCPVTLFVYQKYPKYITVPIKSGILESRS